ncbi:GCN5-related N-acetyltransferase [Methylorubrum populi BJ001]|uniref:GCN5-related N-acetyltransferase n=1 Tax=Methylorubrum populi (strain ATCC BAA-705 / NCIMB 13946 / BJ001) TaxID=441620 RepID=B1ZF73_METPB|nr:GNAT family N-acetyltransferase [Methylorubrum populi]ACB79646.1 GCN5-related N-acetyltransferase [Methylorubrum populi BJ001]OAH38691.1 GCN5 family acetyltransferase [Methylorubrum populi]PZP70475.1 MAG: N-acetyltransferase [Methylorubrum populi]
MSDPVVYGLELDLDAVTFQGILVESGLAPRRPAEYPERLDRILRASDLIVTARLGGRLVGVARTLTDFAFCAYLSDLAVARDCQGRGIGRRLIAETRAAAGPETSLLLTAAPGVEGYYEAIGMARVPHAFRTDRER